MAAAFKQIIIKSKAELASILTKFNDDGWFKNAAEFQTAVNSIQNPTPEDILDQWLTANDNLYLCNEGKKKILTAHKKGLITTWPQYFEKHWNDNDGVLSWFEDASSVLVGKDDGYSDYESYPSFAAFKKANPGLKFIAWPFGTAKAVRKTKKKAKR